MHPLSRELLRLREPDQHSRLLRLGQEAGLVSLLRLPVHTGCGDFSSADLQHLRGAHTTGRRPNSEQLHRAGFAGAGPPL